MKVSILIPCYNAERWIETAIRSALDQTHPQKEVIVVDDGSTDGSLEIIKSFGDAVQWESTTNLGGNHARNRLLARATGDWLQYLDADDYLSRTKVAEQVEFLRENPEADIVCSPVLYEYWTSGKITHTERRRFSFSDDPWTLLIRWRLPQTGGPLWKRSVVEEVGGWNRDQPCCQETELYLRLLKYGATFAWFDRAGAVYRQWSEETVCKKKPLLSFRKRLEIVDAIEEYLEASGGLSDTQRSALVETRMECARSLYGLDAKLARRIAAKAKKARAGLRLPKAQAFPPSYRLAYRVLGFDGAERLARAARRQRPEEPAELDS